MSNTHTVKKRGHASAVSPLTIDLLANDSKPLPVALQAEGSVDTEPRPIPYSRYWDPEFARLEKEKIWDKCWQFACREEDIPNPGDRLPYNVGTMSYIIIRADDGGIHALHNSCMHRGTRLCEGHSSGKSIRCPFHAWEWNNDGTLHNIPSGWDFPQVDRNKYHLPQIKVERWGGFVFVNPDPNAGPLQDSLGILPAHFASWKPEDRFTFVHVRKRVRANWKVVMEAFFEAYHVIATHTDSMPFTGDATTKYDIWEDGKSHISRLITPLGIPSSHLGDDASAQAALDMVGQVYAMALGPDAQIPTFDAKRGRGRAEVAEWRREMLAQGFGKDFSQLSDSEMIDTIQYWMFPNFCPWYGEGLPLTYQFLPYGSNPEESVMSVRMLLPLPGGDVPRPPSAPIIELGFDDHFDSAPEFGLLAHIFDQDMSNVPLVQLGMHSASESRARATLGRYQECRIQYFHNLLGEILQS